MSTAKKILILHFSSLEQYPPVMNLIDYLANNSNVEIIVVSTKPPSDFKLDYYEHPSVNVTIKRTSFVRNGSVFRVMNYFHFYFISFLIMLFNKFDSILYFETISSFSALVYKKWFNRKVKLFAHYHEYNTKQEYVSGMKLVKWFHKFELASYGLYSWISQTNEERLEKFRKDIGLEESARDSIFHSMPNYPPSNWKSAEKSGLHKPYKLVYLGSLGYETMYLKEILIWVTKQNGDFTLDIYAYNIDDKAKEHLKVYSEIPYIHFLGGCNYYDIPKILPAYDIGLVMYKPHSLNTIHAVSNKIMEYMALGLDVWFSSDMTHSYKYIREDCYPKVIPLNFNNLNDFDIDAALNREKLSFVASPYNYDTVYEELRRYILL